MADKRIFLLPASTTTLNNNDRIPYDEETSPGSGIWITKYKTGTQILNRVRNLPTNEFVNVSASIQQIYDFYRKKIYKYPVVSINELANPNPNTIYNNITFPVILLLAFGDSNVNIIDRRYIITFRYTSLNGPTLTITYGRAEFQVVYSVVNDNGNTVYSIISGPTAVNYTPNAVAGITSASFQTFTDIADNQLKTAIVVNPTFGSPGIQAIDYQLTIEETFENSEFI